MCNSKRKSYVVIKSYIIEWLFYLSRSLCTSIEEYKEMRAIHGPLIEIWNATVKTTYAMSFLSPWIWWTRKSFYEFQFFFYFKLHDAGLMYKNNKDASNERESSINGHHRRHSHDILYIVILMIQNITEIIIESSKTNVGKQFHCNFRIKLLIYN